MKNVTKTFKLFKNKKFRQLFFGVVFIVILTVGSIFYLKKENRVSIDDSLVQAPIISLTSSTPGTLQELDVEENQQVTKGEQLAIVGTQVIRAQSDGLVVGTDKQIGSYVTPATAVIQMINPDDFRVVGTLDENKGLKDIKVGQIASFTVDAFPGQTFWGYVDEVAPTAKQTQMSFSISNERPTQQFNIYVRFNNFQYSEIKNGMSAKLTVYTATH